MTAEADWMVDFDRFGPRISVWFSYLAKIGITTTAAGMQMWASSTEADASGAGALLASVDAPLAGTNTRYLGVDGQMTVNNPGGRRYVVLTRRDGVFAAAPVALAFLNIVHSMRTAQ